MNSPIIYFLNTHGVVIFLIVVVSWLWLKGKHEEALHAIIACAIAGLAALVIKELSDVPRPYIAEGLEALAGYSVSTSSTPSLHATLSFALAVTVALHQRRLGIVLIVIAALISVGRVAAYVHYPFDIALGSLLGTVVSFAVENIGGIAHKKRKN